MLIQLNKKMKKNKGFTLIELLVVVAIIAILAVIAIPRFASMSENARVSSWQANHRTLVSGISMYAAAHEGKLPQSASVGNTAGVNDFLEFVADLNFTGWMTDGSGVAIPATPASSVYTWTNSGGTAQLQSTYTPASGGSTQTLTYNP